MERIHRSGDYPLQEGPFEITSAFYKWYLWVVLATSLTTDFLALPTVWANRLGLSTAAIVMLVFGIFLRISILATLMLKRGPLKGLVYIWGALLLFAGLTGFLSFVVADGPTSMDQYLNKFILFALGVSLVAPIGRCVKYAKPASQ